LKGEGIEGFASLEVGREGGGEGGGGASESFLGLGGRGQTILQGMGGKFRGRWRVFERGQQPGGGKGLHKKKKVALEELGKGRAHSHNRVIKKKKVAISPGKKNRGRGLWGTLGGEAF